MRRTVFALVLLLSAILPASNKRSAHLPPVKAGSPAPDFALKAQDGKLVSLHDFRGRKTVVLAFYVFAFTGG